MPLTKGTALVNFSPRCAQYAAGARLGAGGRADGPHHRAGIGRRIRHGALPSVDDDGRGEGPPTAAEVLQSELALSVPGNDITAEYTTAYGLPSIGLTEEEARLLPVKNAKNAADTIKKIDERRLLKRVRPMPLTEH